MLEREPVSIEKKQEEISIIDAFFCYKNGVLVVDRGKGDPIIPDAGLTGIWGYVPEEQRPESHLRNIANELGLVVRDTEVQKIGIGGVRFEEDPHLYSVTIFRVQLPKLPERLIGNKDNPSLRWMPWEILQESQKLFPEYKSYLTHIRRRQQFLFTSRNSQSGSDITTRVFPGLKHL